MWIVFVVLVCSSDDRWQGAKVVDLFSIGTHKVLGTTQPVVFLLTSLLLPVCWLLHYRCVQEKMALLSLMELIFKQSPEGRAVTFAQVAEAAQIPLDSVELLLMRAISVGLIKGTIDEVDQVIRVSWLKPRVLDRDQIQQLGKRFSSWRETVQDAANLVKDHSADVFA